MPGKSLESRIDLWNTSAMQIRRIRSVLLVTFALFVGVAYADWTQIPSSEFFLPNPPQPGSQAYRRDFEELRRWQQTRDEKACALGRAQQAPTVSAFFGPSSGLLTADEYQRAEPRLQEIFKFADRIAGYFKTKYHRKRPYDTDRGIVPCVAKPGGQRAYPSSHAALAAVGACELAKLYPAKAKRIIDYGAYLGRLRVIVGVHHPSDVEAGQSLARQICDRLP